MKYRVTLLITDSRGKQEREYKWHTCETLKEAWNFAHKICREWNKNHHSNAAITGVCKN